MNKLEIFNRTITTVVCYVKLNGFEYTVDNLNRVRLVGYAGNDYNHCDATEEERKAHKELQSSTVEYIRSNISSIVNEMETHLLLQSTSVTDSRHTAIELA
jgi:hypothetical protein